MKSFYQLLWPMTLAMVCLCAGCDRDTVKVYHAQPDDANVLPPPLASAPAPANPDAAAMATPTAPANLPQIKYDLPPDWQEAAPTELRTASFMVANPNGQPADVGVIPLPTSGQEIQLINMWRQQLQLPPAADTNTDAMAAPISVGTEAGKLFDIASETNLIDGKARARILVAMTAHGPNSWFFKMVGEESFVEGKKAEFIQFLKSVSFDTSPAPPAGMTSAAPAPADTSASIWTVPAGWEKVPVNGFLLAKFAITGAGDARAEVNISVAGGGLEANVNRWRGQLGLQTVTGPDLDRLVTTLNTGGTPASVVDFTGINAKTGQKTRLVGVILPLAGQTWFYKLMGDETVVAEQKDAFFKFIQSARYPDVN